MKTWTLLCLCALMCVLTLAACQPEYQIAWSPDGKSMAFIGADGLRIADSAGNLQEPVDAKVTYVRWLPDSKHLITASRTEAKTWVEASKYLTEAQNKEAVELAKYLDDLLEKRGAGGLEREPRLEASPDWTTQAAVLYLRDNNPEHLKSKLGVDKFEELAGSTLTVHQVSTREASAGAGPTATELWRGFGTVTDLRVSPDGKCALIVHERESKSHLFDIELVSLSGAVTVTRVASAASKHASWTADSRQVFYIDAPDRKSGAPIFAVLTSKHVRDKDGSVIAGVSAAPGSPHVHIAADDCADVECLDDGRVLFPCADVHMPATEHELASAERIFSFKPGDAVAKPVTAATADCRAIELLQLSPSQKWAAFVNGDMRVVDLIDIATGNVSSMSAVLKVEPSWRNADEVCFVRPVEKKGANQHEAEVILHNVDNGQDRVLSQNWPAAAVKGLLIPDDSNK